MPDIKLTRRLTALSLGSALLVFLLLSLVQPDPPGRSYYLPTLLNNIQPRLIAGDRASIEPALNQMIRGTFIQRVDLYEADGTLIASVRNNAQPPDNMALQSFSGGIVIDSTLLANLALEEYQPVPAMGTGDRLFISLLAGFCVLATGLLSGNGNRLNARGDSGEPGEIVGLPGDLGQANSDDICLVMVIRISDLQQGLIKRGELDEYGDTLWSLLERMGPAYGICCLGVSEGNLLLGANAANPAVALRHCIMFGWNIGNLSVDRYGRPATWIGLAEKRGSNACYSWMAGAFDGAAQALDQCQQLEPGQFEVCASLQEMIPRSVESEPAAAGSIRVKSLDPAMLALWKRQLRSSDPEN